jgi:stage IV sporulation protein FB
VNGDALVGETPYDLRWWMFGTHVRVHPFFWVAEAFIFWPLLDAGMEFLLIGILCGFTTILLHEFGHVWMGRLFGSEGHIVLWTFGGLAIGSSNLSNRWKRIAVSLAGPGIQILLWAAMYFAAPYVLSPSWPRVLVVGYGILEWYSLYWALLNLLPIWPLDGGWITRDVWCHFSRRNGVRLSLHLSIGVSLVLALHAAAVEQTKQVLIPWVPVGYHAAVFFAIFLFIGIQALQEENSRDRWIDERTSWE